MNNEEKYKAKEDFLKEWPPDRMKKLKLSEYSNLDKESSFCYEMEAKTGFFTPNQSLLREGL